MVENKTKTTKSKRTPTQMRTQRLGSLAMAEGSLRMVEELTNDAELRRRAAVLADGVRVLDGDLRRHLGVKAREEKK